MKSKKKTAVVRMLVVVPRIKGLTVAQHRQSVRDTLRVQSGDFYGLQVRVRGLAPVRRESTRSNAGGPQE